MSTATTYDLNVIKIFCIRYQTKASLRFKNPLQKCTNKLEDRNLLLKHCMKRIVTDLDSTFIMQ